jgi:hypothetical protein
MIEYRDQLVREWGLKLVVGDPLVDLAAQTHEPLARWMDDSGVLDLADVSGLAIHYWHVMDAGRDSVDLLKKLLARFGHRLAMLVRNRARR